MEIPVTNHRAIGKMIELDKGEPLAFARDAIRALDLLPD
jgi:hypothetical protein